MAITLKPTDNVKLKDGSNVFIIKDKKNNSIWRKCKPVTLVFDKSKIKYINVVSDALDYEVSTSGTTTNFPCDDLYTFDAVAQDGYLVYTEEQGFDLSKINSLTLSDFDSVTYTFNATPAPANTYIAIIPGKTKYISSAKVNYSYNGHANSDILTSNNTRIVVDKNNPIYYSNITPVSGYTANYSSSNKFTPTENRYKLPALKVLPKKPTVTLEFTSSTVVRYTITNNNPTAVSCSYTLTATNHGTVTRSVIIGSGKTFSYGMTYSNAPSSATIKAYLFADEQAGTDVTNFDGSSETVTVTATYTPATT